MSLEIPHFTTNRKINKREKRETAAAPCGIKAKIYRARLSPRFKKVPLFKVFRHQDTMRGVSRSVKLVAWPARWARCSRSGIADMSTTKRRDCFILGVADQKGNIVNCNVIDTQGYAVILDMMDSLKLLVDEFGGTYYHEGVGWMYSMAE